MASGPGLAGGAARRLNADRIARGIIRINRDNDFFARWRYEIETDVVRHHRQSASTAVDEHRKFHLRRASVIEKFIERRFDGSPREEHVVNEDDV